MKKKELTGVLWFKKLTERLSLAMKDINEGRMPQENDIEIMKKVYPLQVDGDIIFYRSRQKKTVESSEQQGLFDDKRAEKP